MTSYANARREQYIKDVDAANKHFQNSGDLKAFQTLNKAAKDQWQNDIKAHYNDETINDTLRDALASSGRVYATLNTGEIVRLNTVANLYNVSDITGSPAEPIIARMVPNSIVVKNTTIADIISQA